MTYGIPSHSFGRFGRFATVPVGAWLLAFLVVPLGMMTTQYMVQADITRVLSQSTTWRLIWFSTWQATLSAIATLLIAAPVTWLIGRHHFLGRRVLRALTTVGFLLPSIVVGTAFLALLPRSLHYTVFAVVVAHAYFNLAVVVRVVGTRLEMFDSRVLDAARTLGASPTITVRTIWWPSLRGAVASAAGLIFLYCFTSFAVVRVLGGPRRSTLESDIALRAFGIGDISAATVLALTQLVLIVLIVGGLHLFGGRQSTPSQRTMPTLQPLATGQRPYAVLIGVGTSVFVLLPLVMLFWKSIHVGNTMSLAAWQSLRDTSIVGSLVASLRTALVAGVVGVLLAVCAALGIVRLPSAGRFIYGLSVVPLALSPVTLGLGLLVTFDSGWWDWRAHWWFIAIAHTLVAFPLAVRVLVPTWRSIPNGLHHAAAVLGASETQRLLYIDLRLLRRAIVASVGLIIAVSLGEFGAASLMSRQDTETLPVAIARLLERTGDPVRAQAFVLASVLVLACFAALCVVEIALGRSERVARQ